MGNKSEPKIVKHWRDMLATLRSNAYEYVKLIAKDRRDVSSKQKFRDEQHQIGTVKRRLAELGASTEDDPIDTYDPDENGGMRRFQQAVPGLGSTRPATAELRRFLTDVFSDEDLTTFCFDNFREVYDSFAVGMTKGQKIQLLLEYCENRDVVVNLMAALEDVRSEQFRKRFPKVQVPPLFRSRKREDIAPAHSVGAPASVPTTNPTPSPRLLRVFLCHSTQDKPAVRILYQRLQTDGFDVWLDEEKLLPGQDWDFEIRKAVRQSDVVIVCLSKGSVTKAGYIQKEIKLALDVADEQPEGTIFIIPLKLEECQIPDRLSRWQWVKLFDERGYERLIRALRSRASTLGLSEK